MVPATGFPGSLAQLAQASPPSQTEGGTKMMGLCHLRKSCRQKALLLSRGQMCWRFQARGLLQLRLNSHRFRRRFRCSRQNLKCKSWTLMKWMLGVTFFRDGPYDFYTVDFAGVG